MHIGLRETDMETISHWFIAKLENALTLSEAIGLIREVGEAVGLPKVGVIRDIDDEESPVANGKPLAALMGWPESWLDEFARRQFKHYEPNTAYCRYEHRPYTWRTNDKGTIWKGRALSGEPLQAMRFLRQQIGAGITTPVYRPAGRIGHVSWMNESPGTEVDKIFAKHGTNLFFIAHHFIDALDRWIAPGVDQEEGEELSAREKECLRWVALGKTDQEVSEIIYRSPATTRFHVKNAIRKLGAANRAHAVSIAYRRGLLGYQH